MPRVCRALALVPATAGLADGHRLVLGVGERADRRPALGPDHAHLRRRQAQGDHLALFGDQLDRGAGRAAELAALAGLQLYVVDDRADRHLAEREAASGTDVRTGAGLHHVTDPDLGRGQDVALDAVGVVQQGDVGAAVGVVLDRRDLGRDPVPGPLEVDQAVTALGSAAAVAAGDPAVGVAATGLLDALGQLALGLGRGDLFPHRVGREAAPRAGRFCLSICHKSFLSPLPLRLRTARWCRRGRARRSLSSRTGCARSAARAASAWSAP